MPYFELTSKGKTRITDLIELRESEISARLLQMQDQRTNSVLSWKTVKARLNSVIHLWAPAGKMAHSEHHSDYDKLKNWIREAKPVPSKA